jgi:hypothetical protein
MPGWVVVVIDALIGSGVLKAEASDKLGTDEICELARRAVRRLYEEGEGEPTCWPTSKSCEGGAPA